MNPRYRPSAQVWEAVYAADFTLDQVRRRGLALARDLAGRGWRCLVAYDTRFMGQLFARALCIDLNTLGVPAGLAAAAAPLPAVQHALDRRVADCALVVTARNRPYFVNGLLLITPVGAGLTLGPSPEAPAPGAFPPPPDQPAEPPIDLRGPYLDVLREALDLELIRRFSMTIFVDAMGGTAAGAVPALLGEGGQTRAIEINREPDPLFGKGAPLPTGAGLQRLKKLVRESDSHVGLALSADGAALAVVDKQGELIDPCEAALLLAGYLARQQRQRGTVVLPTPAANAPLAAGMKLGTWEESTGLKPEVYADPQPRIADLATQDRPGLLLGCTPDGEYTLGRYAAGPDALLAGMLIVELLARNGGNLRALLEGQRELLR